MANVIAKGVDVSSNNCGGTGNVDFAAVKRAGYDFAMVRIGYGTSGGAYISKSFAPQMRDAKAAGLDLGVYWYSTASTPEQARREARVVLEAVKPYRLTYPVAFDFEYPPVIGGQDAQGRAYAGMPKAQQLDIIDAFMEPIEAAGYYAVLYMSASPLAALRRAARKRVDRYDCWVAQYASKCTYPGAYGMWQHHGDARGFVGKIDGVAGAIDLNDCYRDYPAIIQAAGLNGWKAQQRPDYPEDETVSRAEYDALQAEYDALAGRFKVAEEKLSQIKSVLEG